MESLEGFFRLTPLQPPTPDATSDKAVPNLSQHFTLTYNEHSLLSRGLSFVPTKSASHTARQDVASDLHLYHRRLKLASYFGPTPFSRKPPFSAASQWEPHSARLPAPLLQLLQDDCTTISHLTYAPDAPNLPPDEEQALGDLITARGLVIKPADKGSAVVLMDRADYVSEALRQLNDT